MFLPAMTRRALDLLGPHRNDAYEVALAELREDTREWWADVMARDPDELVPLHSDFDRLGPGSK